MEYGGIKKFDSAFEAMRFLRATLNVLHESSLNKIYLALDEWRDLFLVSYGYRAGSELGEYIEKDFYSDPDDPEAHARGYKVHEYFISKDAEEYPITFSKSTQSRLIDGKTYRRIVREIGTEYSVGFHIAS